MTIDLRLQWAQLLTSAQGAHNNVAIAAVNLKSLSDRVWMLPVRSQLLTSDTTSRLALLPMGCIAVQLAAAASLSASAGTSGSAGVARGASRPLPRWTYNSSAATLPVGWFGSNVSGMENAAQLAQIGRYDLAIFGWQASFRPARGARPLTHHTAWHRVWQPTRTQLERWLRSFPCGGHWQAFLERSNYTREAQCVLPGTSVSEAPPAH